MNHKILNICLILTSLLGYLEWGGGNSMLLLQSEFEIFGKLFTDPKSVLHPFILLPLFGQILLFVTLFLAKPNKILTWSGIACISVLLVFMFIVGLISLNYKIAVSTLPFLITAVITIRNLRKKTPATI